MKKLCKRENSFYFKEIDEIPLLTIDEEKDLAQKAFNGDKKAKDKLIASNLRFVIKIANEYRNRGVDIVDLICEGNIGLIIAANKFNPNANNKFCTYAVWWIRQAIQKAIFNYGKIVKLPQDKKCELSNPKWNVISLSSPVNYGDEEVGTLEDFISAQNIITPEESFIRKSEIEAVRDALSELSEKEQKVLRMRFGFDAEPMSLKEIGTALNYSKEGVRQIERKGLKKIEQILAA